jgi:phosphoesterase RecJ-like protein
MTEDLKRIESIIQDAQNIVVVQADNPDGDSIGSALALEQLLHQMGKTPHLYCGVSIPTYLRYLHGWDRIEDKLPDEFDASIFVDVSTLTLLEKINTDKHYQKLQEAPCIVIDHHGEVEKQIDFADVTINDDTKSSAGEVVYSIAKELKWNLTPDAAEPIMTAILGDTQGLSNELARPSTYRVMAELIEIGVDRPRLEYKRREYSKMPEIIYSYKADLIKRTKFYLENKLAIVVIPQSEIDTYSPLYNPGPLIQADILQVEDVAVVVVLKRYDDGKTTAAIRSNAGYKVAGELAEHFGGGGHPFAAGFKLQDNTPLDELLVNIVKTADALLKEIND